VRAKIIRRRCCGRFQRLDVVGAAGGPDEDVVLQSLRLPTLRIEPNGQLDGSKSIVLVSGFILLRAFVDEPLDDVREQSPALAAGGIDAQTGDQRLARRFPALASQGDARHLKEHFRLVRPQLVRACDIAVGLNEIFLRLERQRAIEERLPVVAREVRVSCGAKQAAKRCAVDPLAWIAIGVDAVVALQRQRCRQRRRRHFRDLALPLDARAPRLLRGGGLALGPVLGLTRAPTAQDAKAHDRADCNSDQSPDATSMHALFCRT
jgi:hypothetical protein